MPVWRGRRRWCRIVVDDRDVGLVAGDEGARVGGPVDVEVFVRLVGGVADDVDRDCLALLPCGEGDRAADGLVVVVGDRCGSVDG